MIQDYVLLPDKVRAADLTNGTILRHGRVVATNVVKTADEVRFLAGNRVERAAPDELVETLVFHPPPR